LKILASLDIPIYLTTSYHDFMERALVAADKTPRTQLCFWNLETENVDEEHRPISSYKADIKNPLVFHLFGLEQYPNSMVLSEDDYMDFLVRVARDEAGDSGDRVIPPYLEAELRDSSLLLLGYRLQDWDFRVLFRGLLKDDLNQVRQRREGVAIQLNPKDQPEVKREKDAKTYLSKYFKAANIRVHWGSTDDFIVSLCKEWQKRTPGGDTNEC
jgi:hypothetical protein